MIFIFPIIIRSSFDRHLREVLTLVACWIGHRIHYG
jgi:hypothetical protein